MRTGRRQHTCVAIYHATSKIRAAPQQKPESLSGVFRNLAASLVRHEIIRTTVPKAKELRRVVEPLITRAKVDSVANRRIAFARLRGRGVCSETVW